MDLSEINKVLSEAFEDLVEGLAISSDGDMDHGMTASAQKRLKVKRMHKPKGAKKVERPHRTHLPFGLQ